MSTYVRQVKKLSKPLAPSLGSIDIELTERCNNRCIHCYINQPEDDLHLKALEMDTAFAQDVLKQAASLGCLSVRFTGGEPLLREDFSELYLFARRLGLKVFIFTNARLITPELVRLFSRIPPGKPIEVSVYGMHAPSYDAVTAMRGAFKQFWQGITLLREHHIPFIVKQSLLPQNRDELTEFETFAATLPQMELKPTYAMNFDLRARRDDPAKNRLIRRLRLSPDETLAMLTREPEKYIEGMRQFAAKFMYPTGDKIFSCGAGERPCVDAYGRAQMCMLLRHPDTVYALDPKLHHERNPESNLQPLEYALTEFFPQVRRTRAANAEYLERCAACFLKGLCEQCPAQSWEEHGTLDSPVDYLCQVAHVQATYLGLLSKGEKSWELAPGVWQARLKAFTNTQKA
jgi:MoaA/NifB/PqqE/SkfB family radical SAM enzyme